MELGIYTFGDITPDPNTGRAISTTQRYAEILAAAKLADETGLHVFGVGEHHRLDLPISSPAVVMAAIAGGTKRIRLSSAVTILDSNTRMLNEHAQHLLLRMSPGCRPVPGTPSPTASGCGPHAAAQVSICSCAMRP